MVLLRNASFPGPQPGDVRKAPPADATLLGRVEAFLRRNPGFSATTLGKRALANGSFVKELRGGARPRKETVERLEAFMREWGR